MYELYIYMCEYYILQYIYMYCSILYIFQTTLITWDILGWFPETRTLPKPDLPTLWL